jgi:hypothetical protein
MNVFFITQYETKSNLGNKEGQIAEIKNFYIDYVHTIGLQENITI